MIIEREKRHIVMSQTDKEFRLLNLCATVFVPETEGEARIVRKFVEKMVPSNETSDEKAAQARDAKVVSVRDWAADMELKSIRRHLVNLREHPLFDKLIEDIAQSITDVEDTQKLRAKPTPNMGSRD